MIIGWNPRQLDNHLFDGKTNCDLLGITFLILVFSELIFRRAINYDLIAIRLISY